jgi:hypothetical protein
MTFSPWRLSAALPVLAVVAAVGCSSNNGSPTTPGPNAFTLNPCSGPDTLDLAVGQTALADCSQGGTTVTLAGNGASYLIVAEMPTDAVFDAQVGYSLASGSATAAASISAASRAGGAPLAHAAAAPAGTLPPPRNMAAQHAFTGRLLERGREMYDNPEWSRSGAAARQGPSADYQPPPLGTTRVFHVNVSFSTSQFQNITAALAYAGTNVLLYIDQASPAPGFTPAQVAAFGTVFDQTLYDIDSTAFGPPSDIDQNGRVIMLLTPAVNALVNQQTCLITQGYISGYFNPEDFAGSSDPNSNQGEIFYSEVPDPNGTVSCAHSVDDVGYEVEPTFVHELQHLINYSQHVVLRGGNPQSSWLDEGLSIIAEELGSLYYEQKCPPPACRTRDPYQIFPDSSEAFASGFLYDSYFYALLPDTASLTLHDDSENGVSWRGGDWLLVRWLADHFGSGIYRQLEDGPPDGVAAIEAVTGQSFPALLGNFGLALYADSLPGLPRTTAPASIRFVTRNLSQLWARLYTTTGPPTIPTPRPLYLYPITNDTSTAVMDPGTMTFNRLDTPASSPTVTIRFSTPGGFPIPAILHPQLAIYRLPPGQ